MKAMGTCITASVSACAGMVAGAYLVMNVPAVRRLYRCTKRAATKIMGI